MKPLMNKDDQRSLLKALAAVQKNAEKGVHTHDDYRVLVRAIIKLVKTVSIEED
jgi:hypothetical protein